MSSGSAGISSSSLLSSNYFGDCANRSAISGLDGNTRESVVFLQELVIYPKRTITKIYHSAAGDLLHFYYIMVFWCYVFSGSL